MLVSLLDRGPHTLDVWLAEETPDPVYGGTTKSWPGLPIRVDGAMVQPVTAAEATSLGIRPDTSYKVICRTWPGGMWSKVNWSGRTVYQRGETRIHSVGRRTRHHSAVLVTDVTEVK